jgi:hypothetical protein
VVHKIILYAVAVYGARVHDYSCITKLILQNENLVIFVIMRVTANLLIKFQTHSAGMVPVSTVG